MAANHRPTPSPNATTTGASPAPLVAAMQAAGVNPGDVLADRDALARVMCDTLQGLDRDTRPAGPRRESCVARCRWADRYPADRRLPR